MGLSPSHDIPAKLFVIKRSDNFIDSQSVLTVLILAMKYFNAVLLVITVTNVYTAAGACVSCKEVTELFDIINGKLDTIIKNGGGGGTPVCKPLSFQNLGVANAKLVIDAVRWSLRCYSRW